MKAGNSELPDQFFQTLKADLAEHIEVCKAVYHIIEREARALTNPQSDHDFAHTNNAREQFLPILDKSLKKLKNHRSVWENLPIGVKSSQPEIKALLTQGQDMIMKIITLDRDNETRLLKSGAIPIDHIPSAKRQQPGFVARMYQQYSRNS